MGMGEQAEEMKKSNGKLMLEKEEQVVTEAQKEDVVVTSAAPYSSLSASPSSMYYLSA